MDVKNFLEGMHTLRPYYTHPDGYNMGAEHDIIYMYATNKPLTESDVQKMFALGWFQPECIVDGDHGPYSFEDGWAAHT